MYYCLKENKKKKQKQIFVFRTSNPGRLYMLLVSNISYQLLMILSPARQVYFHFIIISKTIKKERKKKKPSKIICKILFAYGNGSSQILICAEFDPILILFSDLKYLFEHTLYVHDLIAYYFCGFFFFFFFDNSQKYKTST